MWLLCYHEMPRARTKRYEHRGPKFQRSEGALSLSLSLSRFFCLSLPLCVARSFSSPLSLLSHYHSLSLSVCLYVFLSVCQSVSYFPFLVAEIQSASLFFSQSVSQSVSLFVRLSDYRPVGLSIHPSIHPSICLSVSLSVSLALSLSLHLPVCLSLSLSLCLSPSLQSIHLPPPLPKFPHLSPSLCLCHFCCFQFASVLLTCLRCGPVGALTSGICCYVATACCGLPKVSLQACRNPWI